MPTSPTDIQNTTPDDTASESTPLEASPEASNSLSPIQRQMLPITAEVGLGGQTIGLEVAQSRQEQTIGLMNRAMLADDRGMLFPFSPPETVNFWMKNVLIPLDMVFVYQGEVVAIAPDVPPCIADPCPTYGPEEQLVDYVIELRGGRAEDLGVQIGDPVAIQWLETSQ
ncbi:MAG: DUF192 domain-containing protein [Cyanobacteria bacterium J06636_16]